MTLKLGDELLEHTMSTVTSHTNSQRKQEHLNIALNKDVEFKDVTTLKELKGSPFLKRKVRS